MELTSAAAQPTVIGHCPTIAAIATPAGPGGIGIVRISGHTAIFIAKQLFCQKNTLVSSRLRIPGMTYGAIADSQSPGNEFLDEAICLVFCSPHSYTGEDVVEFQCHGGQVVLRRVLDAVLRAGARPAAPGEFTRRAYLNGRIDLTEAEAVMQLVCAGSEQAARAASAAMGGALSKKIAELRRDLIAQAAEIAAWADYPEEEFDDPQLGRIAQVLSHAAARLAALIMRSSSDQAVLSGVRTAIVGPPNAGKSSLMNRLAGYDRSIVTELPGTTRDTVTETIQLGNLVLRLTDTAGMRESEDRIERMGVERSRAAMAGADLVLAVFDITQPMDQALLASLDPARTIVVLNKSDLVACGATEFDGIRASALTGQGMEALAAAIETLLGTANFSPNEAILANQRQTQSARDAHACLQEALRTLEEGYPLDAVAICLEDAIQALYALTGERASEAIVDEVFSSFCVGK